MDERAGGPKPRLGRRAYLKGVSPIVGVGAAGCLGVGTDSGPIRVGNLSPFSGGLGWIGPNSRRGIRTALAGNGGVNRATIDGRTVEIVERDTETDPETAIAGFRSLDDAGVETMVGPSSVVAASLFRPALTARLSFVSPVSGTTQLDNIGGTYIWRTVPSDTVGARAQARFAYQEPGWRRMALAYRDSKGSYSFSKASGEYFSSLGGDVVTEVELNPNATDYRSAVRTIQDAGASVVSLTAGTTITGQFIRDYVSLGADDDFAILLGNDVLTSAFIDEMGADTMEGMVGQTPAPGPAIDAFTERYDAIHGTPPGIFAAAAYDAMNLIALAFVTEGEPNRRAVPDHLRKIGNPPGTEVSTFAAGKAALEADEPINYVGAATPQSFNEYGDPLGSFAINQVVDGSWQTVTTYTAEQLSERG
ncbi:ABC-type branched-chain amino acid transport system, periplasmic component [Halapricum desulfuricans]|uniref:ABC-type branched-chain amino acid transport system, periplasmic component n=1 Tax=Halapricum desulfuricans TaxID=2841257 RepID=A0A897NKJ8_9EURY|nr:ABC transporter substrate-binding protein [Halapricum desulfuricans]QSG13287.1 ABC-type branched-chain amino acid transport system, periplasmic component [Halapricum desulfuricans]